MAVNNTENEKYNAFFYLTDCSPYEDRPNRSLTSLLSAMIETWQSHDLLTAGCDILHRHKRIYLSSWPWLPTVTMPDHRVITTFTLVKFLLSFAAFTEVLVSVYTRKMFTWVSKLSYLSQPFKSKRGISYFGKISSCMDYSGVTVKKKQCKKAVSKTSSSGCGLSLSIHLQYIYITNSIGSFYFL